MTQSRVSHSEWCWRFFIRASSRLSFLRFDYRIDSSRRTAILGRLGTGRCQQRNYVRYRISHSPTGIHSRECLLLGRERNQLARMAPIQVLLSRVTPPPGDSRQTAIAHRPIEPRSGTQLGLPFHRPHPERTYDYFRSRLFRLLRMKRPPPRPE